MLRALVENVGRKAELRESMPLFRTFQMLVSTRSIVIGFGAVLALVNFNLGVSNDVNVCKRKRFLC